MSPDTPRHHDIETSDTNDQEQGRQRDRTQTLESTVLRRDMPSNVLVPTRPEGNVLAGNDRSVAPSALNSLARDSQVPTRCEYPPLDGIEYNSAGLLRARKLVAQKQEELEMAIRREETARNEAILSSEAAAAAASAGSDRRITAQVAKYLSHIQDLAIISRKRRLEEDLRVLEELQRAERERTIRRALHDDDLTILGMTRSIPTLERPSSMHDGAITMANYIRQQNMNFPVPLSSDLVPSTVPSVLGRQSDPLLLRQLQSNQNRRTLSDLNLRGDITGSSLSSNAVSLRGGPLHTRIANETITMPTAYTLSGAVRDHPILGRQREQQALSDTSEANSKNSTGDDSPVEQPGHQKRFNKHQCKQWTEKFQELQLFKKKEGHTNVPHLCRSNPGLAMWVKRQRHQYNLRAEGKQSTLTGERIRLLESIGFVWNCLDKAWDCNFEELRIFTACNGHCNVPSNYARNPKLASWVITQRRQLKHLEEGKQSSMTNKRLEKLRQIGFTIPPGVLKGLQGKEPANDDDTEDEQV